MKNNVFLRFCLFALLASLAACSTPMAPAPIVERGGEGQAAQPQSQTQSAPSPAPARGYYEVKKGDTLTHVALENGQSPRDIATWNNLANPNDIKVGQVLRVLPPEDNAAAGPAGGSQSMAVPPQGDVTRTPLPPQGAQSLNKTGPRGEKKPYSDAAFADMQKPDAAPAAAPVAPVALAHVPAAASAPTAADKAADTSGPEETVNWGWPADGKPMEAYEDAKKGIDIAGNSGQPVVAAANGHVLFVGTMRGYGNLVIVKHTKDLWSAYAHNKTILVKEGQNVTKGQQIAEMGDSDTDSVKLHFELRKDGKPVDPLKYLPTR